MDRVDLRAYLPALIPKGQESFRGVLKRDGDDRVSSLAIFDRQTMWCGREREIASGNKEQCSFTWGTGRRPDGNNLTPRQKVV